MGVNMAGYCISDDRICQEASKYEVVRRYYNTLLAEVEANTDRRKEIERIENIMDQLGITPSYRKVVSAVLDAEKEFDVPCAGIELPDGHIVIGKRKDVMGSFAAAVINALKYLAGIDDNVTLVPKYLLDPVQKLKTVYLGSHNACLHTDEALLAISVAAAENETAAKALEQLPRLVGCDAHSTHIPTNLEMATFRRINVNLTCEPKYEGTKLFRL